MINILYQYNSDSFIEKADAYYLIYTLAKAYKHSLVVFSLFIGQDVCFDSNTIADILETEGGFSLDLRSADKELKVVTSER